MANVIKRIITFVRQLVHCWQNRKPGEPFEIKIGFNFGSRENPTETCGIIIKVEYLCGTNDDLKKGKIVLHTRNLNASEDMALLGREVGAGDSFSTSLDSADTSQTLT